MNSRLAHALPAVLIFGCLLAGGFFLASQATRMNIGTEDFVSYWSGFHAFIDGKDPYQTADLAPYQEPLGLPNPETQPILNPPWIFPLVAAAVAWDFHSSASLWFLLSFGFFSALPLFFLYPPAQNNGTGLAALGITSLFLPAYLCLYLGNLCLVLIVVLGLLLRVLPSGHNILAAVLVLPLLCKPQLFFLVLVLIGIHLALNRRWKTVLCSLLFFGLLNLFLAAFNPSIYRHWMNPDFSPFQLLSSSWINSAYHLCKDAGILLPRWSLFLPALLATLALAFLALKNHKNRPLENLLPWALFGACLTSPYVWAYDYSLLALPFLISLKQLPDLKIPAPVWIRAAAWFLAAQALILAGFILFKNMHDHFFIPFVLLLAWHQMDSLFRKTAQRLSP